jgi:SatD family protein
MPYELSAVLIADVMASSKRKDVRALLAKKLTAASKRHLDKKLIRLPYAVTAGDEFQSVVSGLASLPALLLDLRSSFQPLSLRVGIGIGSIADRIRPPVNRLSGEAFQFARRAIENVKSGRLFKFDVLTAFASSDKEFDCTINLIYGLHDTLVLQITRKQWSAIQTFLSRPKLEPAARRLQRDASTVSRSLKRGYYWQLTETARVAGSLLDERFR